MNMYCGETGGEKGRGRKDEGKNPALPENFPNNVSLVTTLDG